MKDWIAGLFLFVMMLAVPLHAAPHRFALALYHFNLQYVAGAGERNEDRVITESFEPLLDLFLAHPEWGADFELQGYMIEVIRDRHPGVLEKLVRLTVNGQIDLVSFHYSDQLFLAFPRKDIEVSIEMTKEVFEEAGLPLSGVVFTQEGQFGEGMLSVMRDQGYSIGILPKNLFHHLHPGEPAGPLFTHRGVDVLIGGEGFEAQTPSGPLQVVWTYMGDGELLATNGADPYLGPLFREWPKAVAEYEQELADLEAAGYEISTISHYVDAVRALGVLPAPLPPPLDGTWQPKDTNNVFRWMGGRGVFVWWEADNEIRTGNMLARHTLLAAETLLAHAAEAGIDPAPFARRLENAWRDQLFGEVSDATGWNPIRIEVEYGRSHSEAARMTAQGVIDDLLAALDLPAASIDTATGAVTLPQDPPSCLPRAEPPIPLQVTAPGRRTKVSWCRVSGDLTYDVVTIAFGAGVQRTVSVDFPFTVDTIAYTPALLDEIVSYPRSAFGFEETGLPLANGLIEITPGRFLVKDTRRVHVAAIVGQPGTDLRFRDETLSPRKSAVWRFALIEGRENALALAKRWNETPTLTFTRP
ncbi:MAG: hypothetical protein D6812_14330 [Deltaproteobacteria bacterium]|nr:MAG: hypothetical protein D6812_14330 [Deltaproteobacteria bacterium]